MNPKFRVKVHENKRTIEGELPHGLLSTGTIPNKNSEHVVIQKRSKDFKLRCGPSP